ncbi:MAG: hypothetical protein WBI57_11565 [Desulfobacterales bacterium]
MIHYPELKYRRRLIGSQRKGRFSRIALSKDYREKFRILQGPGRKPSSPEMALLTPRHIFSFYLNFEDTRPKRCTHTRELQLIEFR